MFMLTHTFFLQKILGPAGVKNVEPDIYVYNIAPDLLAIHPMISPSKTHKLQRSLQIPSQHPKAAYVIYHLLVDDISHHGYISSGDQDEFNLDSKGYCYLKGRRLIKLISNVYNAAGKNISYGETVYQSHLIIEMIYDLIILNHINSYKTIDVMVDAINFTVNNKMNEFVDTIKWLYDLEENEINEVMKSALFFITKESMEGIMNIEGRINLYKDKFGLKIDERLFYDGLKDLFQRAVDSIDDDELFFQETARVIRNYNKLSFLR
jgi:hypothetical protein